MDGKLITTTSSEGLKPLGSQAQRSFELVQSEIAARLGPAHAALFAEPVSTDLGDQTDWYAPRPGQVLRLSDLPEEEQAELKARLASLTTEIRAAGEALSASKESDEQRLGEALVNAVEVPDESAIHAVRDDEGLHPVLINWARLADVRAPVRGVLSAAARPSARPRATTPGSASAAPSPGPDTATPTTLHSGGAGLAGIAGWLIMLGWLLLALMLAAIVALMVEACALNLSFLPSACPVPVTEEEPDAALSEAPVLRNRIAQLERQIAIADRVCQPVFAEEEAALAPPPALPRLPAPPAQQCPPGQVARAPGELVVLVDASGSMEFARDIPEEEEARYYQLIEEAEPFIRSGRSMPFGLNQELLNFENRFSRLPGPDRMAVTREVLSDTVDRIPANIDISMVVFANCNNVQDAGTHTGPGRARLKSMIAALRPKGRTALADAIRLGMGKLQGGRSKADPANILLISDGVDSCGGDPCAMARQAKQQRPGVAINIVDLGRSTQLQCVADATGGFYVQSARLSNEELGGLMREAAGIEGRGLCRDAGDQPPLRRATPPRQ